MEFVDFLKDWADLAAWVGAVTGVLALAVPLVQLAWGWSDRRSAKWPHISTHHCLQSKSYDFHHSILTIRNFREHDYKVSAIYIEGEPDLKIEILEVDPPSLVDEADSRGGYVEFSSSEVIKPNSEVVICLSAYSDSGSAVVVEDALTGSVSVPAVGCVLRLLSTHTNEMKWYKFNCAVRNGLLDISRGKF